jgi:hypothetical protein
MKPRRDTILLERFCVLIGILLLHGGKSVNLEIGQVCPERARFSTWRHCWLMGCYNRKIFCIHKQSITNDSGALNHVSATTISYPMPPFHPYETLPPSDHRKLDGPGNDRRWCREPVRGRGCRLTCFLLVASLIRRMLGDQSTYCNVL